MSGSLLSVWVQLLGKKHRGLFENRIRAAQLEHLTAQTPDLLALLAGQTVAHARIDLGAAHTLAQSLRVDPQIARDIGDRTLTLKRQADPPLHQLLRILARTEGVRLTV